MVLPWGSQRSWGFGHIRLLQRFGVVFGAPGGMSRVWGLEGGFLGGSFTGGLVPGGPGVRGKYVGRVGRSFRVCGLKKAKRHPVLVPIFRVARRNCRTTLRKPAESGNKSFACVCVKCPIGGAGDGGRRGGAQAEGELCNVDGQADPQSSLNSYLLILPLLFPSQFPFILPYLLSALTSPLAAPAPDLHPTTHSRPPTSPPANLFSAFPHSVMLGGRWQGVRK